MYIYTNIKIHHTSLNRMNCICELDSHWFSLSLSSVKKYWKRVRLSAQPIRVKKRGKSTHLLNSLAIQLPPILTHFFHYLSLSSSLTMMKCVNGVMYVLLCWTSHYHSHHHHHHRRHNIKSHILTIFMVYSLNYQLLLLTIPCIRSDQQKH